MQARNIGCVNLTGVYEDSFEDRRAFLAGLGDDSDYSSYTATADISSAIPSGDAAYSPLAAGTTSLSAPSTLSSSTGSSASGASTGWLSSLLTGVGAAAVGAAATVATGAINSATLQATNAQRMASGLPPLNSNGSVMTQAQMLAAGYSTAQVSAFSSQLTSALGISSGSTMLLLAAAAIVGVIVLSEK